MTTEKNKMPELCPGEPVVIRMNGQWEEYIFNTSVLKHENWRSDVVITRWFDNSVAIRSIGSHAANRNRFDGSNICHLTPAQIKVVNHIINFDFDKEKDIRFQKEAQEYYDNLSGYFFMWICWHCRKFSHVEFEEGYEFQMIWEKILIDHRQKGEPDCDGTKIDIIDHRGEKRTFDAKLLSLRK